MGEGKNIRCFSSTRIQANMCLSLNCALPGFQGISVALAEIAFKLIFRKDLNGFLKIRILTFDVEITFLFNCDSHRFTFSAANTNFCLLYFRVD